MEEQSISKRRNQVTDLGALNILGKSPESSPTAQKAGALIPSKKYLAAIRKSSEKALSSNCSRTPSPTCRRKLLKNNPICETINL